MSGTDHLGGRASERELLNGFLDWERAVAARKLDGLTRDDATRAMTPTGLSPLGIVAHLAAVEYVWFDHRFLGNPARAELDAHGEFRIADADTVESVVAEYEAACELARTIAAAADLDDAGAESHPYFGRVTLRWILVHLIEETARHNGHLDLMREQIDGRVGD